MSVYREEAYASYLQQKTCFHGTLRTIIYGLALCFDFVTVTSYHRLCNNNNCDTFIRILRIHCNIVYNRKRFIHVHELNNINQVGAFSENGHTVIFVHSQLVYISSEETFF